MIKLFTALFLVYDDLDKRIIVFYSKELPFRADSLANAVLLLYFNIVD